MNRKQFVESYGASCNNWNWSWSFVNHKDKLVIFGAWDIHTESNAVLLLSQDWEFSYAGRRSPGYPQSVEHMRLVENENYSLKIFPMIFSDEKSNYDGSGPAVIGGFEPTLTDCKIQRHGNAWFGVTKSYSPTAEGPAIFDRLIAFVVAKRAKAIEKDGLKLTKNVALIEMSKYYKENKAMLPANISDYREEIIKAMQSGKPVREAFLMFSLDK